MHCCSGAVGHGGYLGYLVTGSTAQVTLGDRQFGGLSGLSVAERRGRGWANSDLRAELRIKDEAKHTGEGRGLSSMNGWVDSK